MPRKAADAAAGELVAALMAGVERVAAEKVAAQMEALAGKVVHTFVITSKETKQIEPPIRCCSDDV